MNVANIIKQISHTRRVQSELHKQIEHGVASKKFAVNAEGLYKKNEQEYYNLLRSLYELEGFVEENSNALSLIERSYFETLLAYGKTLLKTIRYFPKLTYFFWQKNLGKAQDQFQQRTFTADWSKFQSLQIQTSKAFGRLKQFAG